MSLKALIVGALALVAGIGILVDVARRWWRFRSASYWASGRGRILESYLYRDTFQWRTMHFRVRYEFAPDDGKLLVGETPRLCGDWFWSDRAQAQFVGRYATDQEVEVFYDPADPTRNCLDRDDTSSFAAQTCLAVIVLTAGFILLLLSGWNPFTHAAKTGLH
jgi:hypothetical protein